MESSQGIKSSFGNLFVQRPKGLTDSEWNRVRQASLDEAKGFVAHQEAITDLTNRVAELEEILCPTMSHDWVHVSGSISNPNPYVDYLMCSKCKKKLIVSREDEC